MTTIAQERAALVKVGRPLRLREQWGSRFNYTNVRSVTEPARAAFVHITITEPRNYSSDDAHARAVEAIGISRFPNTGVSYNRLHMQSGRAYEAQPIGRRGAHTVNDKGLAACSTSGCPARGGRFPSGNLNYSVRAYAICQNVGHAVTDAELDSLARSIAADQLAGFVVKGAPIHGHRCVAWKDCPASKMWARMGELERKVNHYVANGFAPAEEDEMSQAQVEEIKAYIDAKDEALRRDLGVHLKREEDSDAQERRETGAQWAGEAARDAAEHTALGEIKAQLEVIVTEIRALAPKD